MNVLKKMDKEMGGDKKKSKQEKEKEKSDRTIVKHLLS
jgi:hypothetical protein